MKTLRLVLGDQLCRTISALRDVDHTRDVVFMAEVHDETTYVRHHKQKLVLVLSAMRHFAESLRAEGMLLDYVQLNDHGNTGSFTRELGGAFTSSGGTYRRHAARGVARVGNDADLGRDVRPAG
jgi:deoxyribodipyrimidine photolyase-related protein